MKAYQKIPIVECGEPLLPIPLEYFVLENPPPYQQLGANYHGKSPYFLRQGVIDALLVASSNLNSLQPGWKIKIFDAYRPLEVQQFMVDYTFNSICKERSLNFHQLSARERENIYQEVYKFWAIPSDNPKTPPPHSTGAALDITLVNHQGTIVDMGGEIDELSERSHPNYYANSQDQKGQEYHYWRELLNQVMTEANFQRHPGEWWHFCLGDQMWVWLSNPSNSVAKYGRLDISSN
jgi:D-alanyl-D-alanine dipeptidase